MDAKLKTDQGKAVVEGKTAVPFKSFVQLVLQRKVFNLFKDWDKEPVIVSSDLLTNLASAPNDDQENREQLILVTLGVGVLSGIFLMAVVQIVLTTWDVVLTRNELLIIAGTLVGLALLTAVLARLKRRKRSQKIAETMEKIAETISK